MPSIREEFNCLPGRNAKETAAELYMLSVMPREYGIHDFQTYMDIYDVKEDLRPRAVDFAFESVD